MTSFAYTSMSLQVSEKDKLDFLENLKLSAEEANDLERNTVGQADNPLWMHERKKRLTASNFGTVCKLRHYNDKHETALGILHPSCAIRALPGVVWGNQHEPVAKREVEAVMNVKIKDCGLFVDAKKPWLAASPDGLVGTDTIVEIKCPHSARDMSPLEGARGGLIQSVRVDNNALKLKDDHYNMYQVQGQLHITDRTKCIYVLWTPKGISTEVILKDDAFWRNEMETKLDDFYKQYLLPVICSGQSILP